jgi:hypothetical protein
MDETTQMVLGAINQMNQKLDDLKDTVADFVADTRSQLATLNQWKRTSEQPPTLEARVRGLEQESVTRAKLEALQADVASLRDTTAGKSKVEALQEELGKLKEEKAASKVRERIVSVIGTSALTIIVTLVVQYLKAH